MSLSLAELEKDHAAALTKRNDLLGEREGVREQLKVVRRERDTLAQIIGRSLNEVSPGERSEWGRLKTRQLELERQLASLREPLREASDHCQRLRVQLDRYEGALELGLNEDPFELLEAALTLLKRVMGQNVRLGADGKLYSLIKHYLASPQADADCRDLLVGRTLGDPRPVNDALMCVVREFGDFAEGNGEESAIRRAKEAHRTLRKVCKLVEKKEEEVA